ncbi:regulator of G protein signaling domain protein, partial [Oesophagostomum dentatum]
VEVPTERRVKRWGLSVQELVKDPIGRQVLETFLESEFSSENIRFWIAIQDLKYSPNDQIDQKTERIYEEFLAPGAPAQVNVDSRTLDQTLDCLQKATNASTRRHAFTHSEEHVFTLMAKDSYPRFVRSQIYKGVLSAAQQQGSRRLGWRNFIFNMGAAKKPQCKPAKKDELHSQNLPKQLSSDSLPVRTAHAVR